MYSKVRIAKQPLHPILTIFSVALYTSTFATLMTYWMTENVFWFRIGYVANVAAVIMAILAAVPTAVDLVSGILSQCPTKPTGVFHMLLNLSVLILFGINGWLMSGEFVDSHPDVVNSLFLTGIGFLLLPGSHYLEKPLVQVHPHRQPV